MEKVSLCRNAFPPPRLLHFTCSSSSQNCAIVLFKVSWAVNLSLLFPFGLRIGQLEIALLENILVLRTQKKGARRASKYCWFFIQSIQLSKLIKIVSLNPLSPQSQWNILGIRRHVQQQLLFSCLKSEPFHILFPCFSIFFFCL